MCLPHHQLVLRWNGIVHSLTNGIRAKVMNLSHGSVIVREGLLGDHNSTSYNHSKKGPRDVMSNVIKDLSVSSSSSIGFEVE